MVVSSVKYCIYYYDVLMSKNVPVTETSPLSVTLIANPVPRGIADDLLYLGPPTLYSTETIV